MEVHDVATTPCPANIIALATNNDAREQHCGIVFTTGNGTVRLCDFKWENFLAVRAVPADFFWVKVALDDYEVLQISEFVEFVIGQHHRRLPTPYSFVYTRDAFDVMGRLRDGVGLTCATFIVGIFDNFKLFIVDLASWKARPKQDVAFRDRIVAIAKKAGQFAVATRLQAELPAFRIKPRELCSSATHDRYPVRFCQAIKLAKTMSKLIRRRRGNKPNPAYLGQQPNSSQ